jgi:hypothetical protein
MLIFLDSEDIPPWNAKWNLTDIGPTAMMLKE